MLPKLIFLALTSSWFTAVRADDNEGLRCTSRQDCVQWYKTGLLSCSSGYERTTIGSVDGEAKGVYCERKCTDAEWQTCGFSNCAFNLKECRLYPGNRICAKALRYCGSPIQVPEKSCTKEAMDEYVKFDAATNQCSIDVNPGPSAERHFVLEMFSENDYGWLKQHWISLDCGPTTAKGAEELWNQIKREGSDRKVDSGSIRTCQGKPSYDQYEPRARCIGFPPSDGRLVRIAAQACENAPTVNGKKPILSIQRDFKD